MRETIEQTISRVVDRYLAEGRAESAYEINCGQCQDISVDFIDAVGRDVPEARGAEVFVDDFLEGDALDDDRVAFDRDRMARAWPEVQPPEDITWDEMDEISAQFGFAGGTHVWVVVEGRHYDAEAPAGVDNPFELPFFLRVFEAFRAGRSPAPKL